jgi:hypothetical protein
MPTPPDPTGRPRIQPGYRNSLQQVLLIQEVITEAVSGLRIDLKTSNAETRARSSSALASLAKGWDCLEDRKRIIRGKPMPGSLRPEAKPKKSRVRKQVDVQESPMVPVQPQALRSVEDGTQKESTSPKAGLESTGVEGK